MTQSLNAGAESQFLKPDPGPSTLAVLRGCPFGKSTSASSDPRSLLP
jgi:hypothetical protein